MKKYIFFLLFLLILSSCAKEPEQKMGIRALETDEVTRVIILFKEEINEKVVDDVDGIIIDTGEVLPLVTAVVPDKDLEELEKSHLVEHVEEDQLVVIHNETVGWGMNRIQASNAWNRTIQGRGVKVAVIDSGIDFEHEDLRIAGGISTVAYTSDYDDDNGHGTHVAGIIAALHNGIGTTGVAPGIDLFAVKSLGADGSGFLSDVIAGIDWSIANSMDIINLSLGMSTHSRTLKAAVDRAYEEGILLVGSAGNNGTADVSIDTISYPAKYDSVIAVGAINYDNARGQFSSQAFSATGPTLEVSAPGVSVYSTVLNNRYQNMSGTSMAAPFVTGILAILKEAHPHLTSVQLRSRLIDAVKDLGAANRDYVFGYGLVQIPERLRKVAELFGKDRYLTGIEIAKGGWPNRSEVVVLGRGDKPIDALTSSVLASKFQSPLLLTRPDQLRSEVLVEIQRLKPTLIYLVGGTAAISREIEIDLIQQGFFVQRISGQTRFDTAVQIANEVGTTNEIFLTTANEHSPDALAIAPYAGMKQIPILLTNREQLPKVVLDYISQHNITQVTMVGGPLVISEEVSEQLRQIGVSKVQRIFGDTRFATSIEIVRHYASEFDLSHVSVASGRNFIDALPGSPYSALQRSPIIFTDTNRLPTEVANWMNEQGLNTSGITVFGGYSVITETVRDLLVSQ